MNKSGKKGEFVYPNYPGIFCSNSESICRDHGLGLGDRSRCHALLITLYGGSLSFADDYNGKMVTVPMKR